MSGMKFLATAGANWRRPKANQHSRACETGRRGDQIDADKSERLAAHRTGGKADCRMTSTAGGLSSERRIRTLWIKTALGIRLQANYLRHAQPEAVRALVA